MLRAEAPPDLVGRTRELGKALAALDKAAHEGVPAILRVAGDAGIGKTSFAQRLAADAQGTGWLTLTATCHQLQQNTPFVPTTRLLLAALQRLPEADRYASGLEASIATLDPALALRLEREPVPAPSKNRYQEIFQRFLDGVGSDHKVLLICDDAQWLDEDSRSVLVGLASRYSAGPLALVFAERRTAEPQQIPGTIEVDLQPLSPDDALLLAKSRFPHLSAVALQAAVQLGRGNPFEILTICEELKEGHALSQEHGENRIREVVAARVGAMSEEERGFLQICALLGDPIEYRVLFVLYEPGRVARIISGAALPYLQAQGPALRFRHALIGDAVRSTLHFDGPARRRIIEALQGIKEKNFTDYQRIAEHAVAVGDADLAVDTYWQLATVACAGRAWSTAIAACRSILQIRDVEADRFSAFYSIYVVALRSNNEDELAQEVLSRAWATARARGITQGLGMLASSLIAVLHIKGRVKQAFEIYRSTVDSLATDGDRSEVIALTMMVAASAYDDDAHTQADRLFLPLMPRATAYARAQYHGSWALRHSSAGDYAAAKEASRNAMRDADPARRQDMIAEFTDILVDFRHHGCSAIDRLEGWLAANRVAGKDHDVGAAFRAWILFARGDWDAARSLSEQALFSDPSLTARVQLLAIVACIAALAGEDSNHETELRRISADTRTWENTDAALQVAPWVLLRTQDGELERQLERAVALLPQSPPWPAGFTFAPLGIALLARKNRKTAWLNLLAGNDSCADRCPWTLMQWELARGVALEALQNKNAKAVFASAAERARRCEADFFAAYAALRAGTATPAEKALLSRLRIADAPGAASKRPEGLTPRELQVARLVADGKTNKQVAETLVLSERTVERHLGNIFEKTAIDSRSKLVRWLFENGLVS